MTCGVNPGPLIISQNMAEGEGSASATQTEQTAEEQLGMRAVLVGATGAVGECLLGELLTSKNFAKVVTLGRRNATVPEAYTVDMKAEESSGRLEQHVIDFETLSSETVGDHLKDKDVFFCTLGTTRRAAGSAAAFRHVDYDYVVKCAEIAKEANVLHMSYCSSQGAKASSYFLYLKTKGEVEEALKKFQFAKTSIFRPGFLDRGNKKRFVEKMAGYVMSSIAVSKVAQGMMIDAEHFARCRTKDQQPTPSDITYENADILALLSSG